MPKKKAAAKVSLAFGRDRQKNLAKALDLLKADIKSSLRGKKKVLIIPNVLNAFNPHVCVPGSSARTVINFLSKLGATDITVGCIPMKGSVLDGPGYGQLSQEANVWNMKDESMYALVPAKDVDGNETPMRIPAKVKAFDYVVLLSKPKTHNVAQVAIGIEDAMGCVHVADKIRAVGTTEYPAHMTDSTYIKSAGIVHKNLLEVYKTVSPSLSVIDGFDGTEGEGPEGKFVEWGVALASLDPFAADAVCASMMGFAPKEIGYLYYAGVQKLGESDLAKIEVVGEKPEKHRRVFKRHKRYALQAQWQLG